MAENVYDNLAKNRNKFIYVKKSFFLLLIFTLVLSMSGCFLIPKEETVLAPPLKEPPKVVFDTVNAKKGVFEKKVTCIGYFISATQRDLCFVNLNGRLKAIYVKPGDVVKKGTLLAELMTNNIGSQIKQQEINLMKAKTAYNAAVSTEESKISIERAKLDYDIAVASEESEVNIRKAKLEYDAAVAAAKNKTGIEQARLDVEQEQIKLDDLNKTLSDSRLISPIDGTVDYITDAKDGDLIDNYKTVVRVAVPNDLQIQYTGDKNSEFSIGMKVEIKVDGEIYPGKVVMTPSSMPKDADEKIKDSIRIKLDKLPEKVKIGDSADITLVLVRKENVIVINSNLIHKNGQRKFVNVLEDGVKRERDVETGEENQTETIIISGITESDNIIKN